MAARRRETDVSLYEFANLKVNSKGERVGDSVATREPPELDLRGNLISYEAPRQSYLAPKHTLHFDYFARLADIPGPLEGPRRPLGGTRHYRRGYAPEGARRLPRRLFWEAATPAYEQPLIPAPISGTCAAQSTDCLPAAHLIPNRSRTTAPFCCMFA